MALLPGTPTAVEMTTVLARDVTDPADGTLIFAVEDQIISCYDSSLSVIDTYAMQIQAEGFSPSPGRFGQLAIDVLPIDIAFDNTTNRLYVLGWGYYDGSGGFAVQKPYVGVWTIDVTSIGTFQDPPGAMRRAAILQSGDDLPDSGPYFSSFSYIGANGQFFWLASHIVPSIPTLYDDRAAEAAYAAGKTDIPDATVPDDLSPAWTIFRDLFSSRGSIAGFDMIRNDDISASQSLPVLFYSTHVEDLARSEVLFFDDVNFLKVLSQDTFQMPGAGASATDALVRVGGLGIHANSRGYLAVTDQHPDPLVWLDAELDPLPANFPRSLPRAFCISDPSTTTIIPVVSEEFDTHVEMLGVTVTPEERTFDEDGALLSVNRAVTEVTVAMKPDNLPLGFYTRGQNTSFVYEGTLYTLSSLSYDHAEGFVQAQFII